jgi:hypothetical protein
MEVLDRVETVAGRWCTKEAPVRIASGRFFARPREWNHSRVVTRIDAVESCALAQRTKAGIAP